MPPARDFVADAFAHCKFIAYTAGAKVLFAKAGIMEDDLDDGCIALEEAGDAKTFVTACRALRLWQRESDLG